MLKLTKKADYGLIALKHLAVNSGGPSSSGGYRLARDASKITALEVIRAIDGPIILTACFTAHGECEQSEKCNVREPLRKVHEGILQLLNTITISDMSKDEPTNALLRIS